MMTESEAKTKWCPYVRVLARPIADVAVNRAMNTGAPDPDCMCLASGCMAWRWVINDPKRKTWQLQTSSDEEVLRSSDGPSRPEDVPANALWVPLTGDVEDYEGVYWNEPIDEYEPRVTAARKIHGYCGAFGTAWQP